MWKRLTTLLFILLLVTTVYASLNGCSTATVSPTIETLTPEPTAITVEETATVPTYVQVDIYNEARNRLVEQGIIGYGIDDPLVIDVMQRTPRHLFVPEDYLDMAYANHHLPIGYGQTISQPFIVALMTQELGVGEGDRVLEIGTGSGYQPSTGFPNKNCTAPTLAQKPLPRRSKITKLKSNRLLAFCPGIRTTKLLVGLRI